jgi:drug/metabolite transporter (DMT)-like permease
VSNGRESWPDTACGLAAIVIWAGTVAVSRSLTEKLGMFTAGFYLFLGGAVVSMSCLALRPGPLRAMLSLPRRYLLVCGGLFSFYTVVFYAALGLASDRQAAVVVGIINYLWPALTLLFSVIVLKRQARWWLYPGMLLALCGIALALGARADGASSSDFLARTRANLLPYGCALAGAVCWALYSNYTKLLAGEGRGAVPLFLCLSALMLGVMRLLVREQSAWSARAVGELAYAVAFPISLGYALWDRGMRRGNLVLLATASYFIPLCSTLIISLYLSQPVPVQVWVGCGLVTVGALVCKRSFR